MKCKCGKEMFGRAVWDDDQATDIAYNLCICDCGMIYKETPTALEGQRDLWIPPTLSHLDNENEVVKWIKDLQNGFIS